MLKSFQVMKKKLKCVTLEDEEESQQADTLNIADK